MEYFTLYLAASVNCAGCHNPVWRGEGNRVINIVTFIIGTAFILTGIAAIMINLGYHNWSLLVLARKLWPVLLILAGLGILWKGVIPRWLAIVLLLVMTGILIALFLLGPGLYPLPGTKHWFFKANSLLKLHQDI